MGDTMTSPSNDSNIGSTISKIYIIALDCNERLPAEGVERFNIRGFNDIIKAYQAIELVMQAQNMTIVSGLMHYDDVVYYGNVC